MLIDLPALLAPQNVPYFLDHYHHKTRMVIHSPQRGRAVGLLPWSVIDQMVAGDIADEKNFSVARDSRFLPSPFFRGGKKDTLRPAKLDDLIRQGVSFVIDDIRQLTPAVRLLADDVERRLGCNVGVNAYFSFGLNSAFQDHFDCHDVLIVQVHGRKRWRFAPGPIAHPILYNRTLMGDERQWEGELILEAGDVLYVPRGQIHVASLVDEPSVHLTLGFYPPQALHYLDHVRQLAEAEPKLRQDLLRHQDPETAREHEAAVKQRLHHLIDAATFADLFAASDAKRDPSPYLYLGDFDVQDHHRLVPGLRRIIPLPHCPPGSSPVTVTVGGDKHVLPPAAVSILDRLFTHENVAAGDLWRELGPIHGLEAVRAGLELLLRRGVAVDVVRALA